MARKSSRITKEMSKQWITDALNQIGTRVKRLEHNDGANQDLWSAFINEGRARAGRDPVQSLPGFVAPALYESAKALPAPRRRKKKKAPPWKF